MNSIEKYREKLAKKLGPAVAMILLAASVVSAATTGDVKVFVTTRGASSSGFVDADQKIRDDSVNEVKKHLERSVIIVGTEAEADVVIEVMGRSRAATPSEAATGRDLPGDRHTYQETDTVYLELRAGDYRAEFSGSAPPQSLVGTGSYAAKQASQAALDWIKQNHDRLIARRKKAVTGQGR